MVCIQRASHFRIVSPHLKALPSSPYCKYGRYSRYPVLSAKGTLEGHFALFLFSFCFAGKINLVSKLKKVKKIKQIFVN